MKKIISMMMVVICICGTHYNVRAEENEYIAVSYTHLTLPTN